MWIRGLMDVYMLIRGQSEVKGDRSGKCDSKAFAQWFPNKQGTCTGASKTQNKRCTRSDRILASNFTPQTLNWRGTNVDKNRTRELLGRGKSKLVMPEEAGDQTCAAVNR
jgi:hypothetical protein